jgi:protein-tyrosine phosphatase
MPDLVVPFIQTVILGCDTASMNTITSPLAEHPDRPDHTNHPDRLQGAPNFRAIEALPAADGRRLKRLRLFRSDALHRLSDDDLARLRALRIDTVLDLRRQDEREMSPSRWPHDSAPLVRVFDAVPELQAVRAGGWHESLNDPSFDAERARLWMIETYARMPTALAPAVSAAITHACTAQTRDTPLLVHCTAGKDRTGFVCAMVLAAVGVPRESILADYFESSVRRPSAEMAEVLLAYHGIERTPRKRSALEVITSVQDDFLMTSFRTVERDYGSVEDYLSACGLGADQRDALHAALLD